MAVNVNREPRSIPRLRKSRQGLDDELRNRVIENSAGWPIRLQ